MPLRPPSGEAELVEVRLQRLPLGVLAASREHHDDLLREFRLMALASGSRRARPG